MLRQGKLPFICAAALALVISSRFLGTGNNGICRAEALPDPTRPPTVIGQPSERPSAPSNEKWQVTSILVSPGRRVAIINGQRQQEGDKVAGAILLKIDPLTVTLRKNGRDFTVGLGGDRVKKPVAVSRKEAIGQ